MVTEQNIDTLISSVEQTVQTAVAFFQANAESEARVVGIWTPREVLCHMIYWHQATLDGINSVAGGGDPLPRGCRPAHRAAQPHPRKPAQRGPVYLGPRCGRPHQRQWRRDVHGATARANRPTLERTPRRDENELALSSSVKAATCIQCRD